MLCSGPVALHAGCYAEYMAVPEDQLAAIPAGKDFISSAAIPCTALTAWQVDLLFDFFWGVVGAWGLVPGHNHSTHWTVGPPICTWPGPHVHRKAKPGLESLKSSIQAARDE